MTLRELQRMMKTSTVDRREFLRMAAASAAMLAANPAQAAEAEPAVVMHGALMELPAGAVEPKGWLRNYLALQATELGSQLPEVSWPFTAQYWNGLEEGPSWWPWEQRAYWIDGATRLAIVMRDTALLQKAMVPILYTLGHAGTNGYLGPRYFEDPVGNEHRWPQNVFFRGLMACADARVGPSDIAKAMQRHYRNDPADYGIPERNITNLEPMLWCYQRTGDPKLLALAEDAWRRYQAQVADQPSAGDLSAARVYANTLIRSHGVTYAETAKLPALLYACTGNPEYLRFAIAAQHRIFSHHMLVDGIPSTSEWFRTRTSIDSHETCDIVDHTWGWGYLLQATGDGMWSDRIERACFNAGPGAIRSDWKSLQYFSCPNQFLATASSDHNVMEHGGFMMAYQPNPGRRTACCGGNVHRLFPNYVIRMWMRRADGGLTASLYGPSLLRTVAGRDNEPVEIEQITNYPFDETITLRFGGAQKVAFPLGLRVPGWCANPQIVLNGKPVPVELRQRFVTMERTFAPGDTIVLTFPMAVARTAWPYGGVALERGPLVYSLPIKENWTFVVTPEFSTAAFPGYNAEPASAWNYGLVLKPGDLASQVKVSRQASPEAPLAEPWSEPPVTLTVPARTIVGYELQSSTNQDGQAFTPPLPDLATSQLGEIVEEIVLVPYGCTQLRATIFPDLGATPNGAEANDAPPASTA